MTEAGMRLGSMTKSSDDCYRPYKVSFPGKYDPVESRPSKDPRLGETQKFKEKIYRKHGFKDDDDDDADVRVINRPFYGPFPTNFSPSLSMAESSTEHERTIFPLTVVRMPYHGPPAPYSSLCTSQAEKAKWFEQQWEKKLKQTVEHEAELLKETDCLCAETAIKFYNQKHGTDYKIVETLGSYVRIYTGFWHHCNFRAQSRSHPSPPKLFFAELNKTAQRHVVKFCMPLDDGLVIRSPIVRGCEICGNQLLHPVNGFEAGRWFGSSSSCRAYR